MSKLTRKEISRLGGKALVDKRGVGWMSYIGSQGGKALVEKYGHDWMVEIGLRGAEATARLYVVMPYGSGQYMLIRREDSKVVAIF